MTVCLGTNLCEIATGMVTLEDGSVVCNACEFWRAETEARRLLTYPIIERRKALSWRDEHRPASVMAKLRTLMARIHERERAKRIERPHAEVANEP